MIGKIIKYNDIKYYVNEEKRIVTAVWEGRSVEYALVEFFRGRCGTLSKNTTNWNPAEEFSIENKLYLPLRFVGVAYCNENDVFDVEVGKNIARLKLECKVTRAVNKCVTRYRDAMEKYIEEVTNLDIHLKWGAAAYICHQQTYNHKCLEELNDR